MDMDKTSPGETFDPGDYWLRCSSTTRNYWETAEILTNVEQPNMETTPNVEKENPKISTKSTSWANNILSQEELDALKKTNTRA